MPWWADLLLKFVLDYGLPEAVQHLSPQVKSLVQEVAGALDNCNTAPAAAQKMEDIHGAVLGVIGNAPQTKGLD